MIEYVTESDVPITHYLVMLHGAQEKVIVISETNIEEIIYERVFPKHITVVDMDLMHYGSILLTRCNKYNYKVHEPNDDQILAVNFKMNQDLLFPALPEAYLHEKIFAMRGFKQDFVLVALKCGILCARLHHT